MPNGTLHDALLQLLVHNLARGRIHLMQQKTQEEHLLSKSRPSSPKNMSDLAACVKFELGAELSLA